MRKRERNEADFALLNLLLFCLLAFLLFDFVSLLCFDFSFFFFSFNLLLGVVAVDFKRMFFCAVWHCKWKNDSILSRQVFCFATFRLPPTLRVRYPPQLLYIIIIIIF